MRHANAPSSRSSPHRQRLKLCCRWQRARPAVLADRNIGEGRLGHLARLVRGEMASPRLDADGHRAMPRLNQLAVTADLVSDKHRLMENHAIDGYGRAPPLRAPRRQTAPGEKVTNHRKYRRSDSRRLAWRSPALTAWSAAILAAVLVPRGAPPPISLCLLLPRVPLRDNCRARCLSELHIHIARCREVFG
jgi:hypothetical protein